MEVIRDLAKKHTTMLIVTHEMRFAREAADKVVFMADGQLWSKALPSRSSATLKMREQRTSSNYPSGKRRKFFVNKSEVKARNNR